MNRSLSVSGVSAFAIALLLVLVAFPFVTHAQTTSADLRAVIRASLLSDPRTAQVSAADLDAMVNTLAQEAQKNGITAADINGQAVRTKAYEVGAQPSLASSGEVACTSWPPLCTFNAAFGFDDPNSLVPYILGASSIGIVWILAEVFHMRSRRKK